MATDSTREPAPEQGSMEESLGKILQRMEEQDAGKGGIPYDKIATRGGGGVILVLLMLGLNEARSLRTEVSGVKETLMGVTTQMEIVSPKDLRADITALDKRILTKDEFKQIVKTDAPWTSDKPRIELELASIKSSIALITERMKQDDERESRDTATLKELDRRLQSLEKK